MNKQEIIDNWDNLYKSYLKLNPDLEFSGITSKRGLLNHFIKYGYDEGRKVIDKIEPILKPKSIVIEKPIINNNKFYLESKMIIEKLD